MGYQPYHNPLDSSLIYADFLMYALHFVAISSDSSFGFHGPAYCCISPFFFFLPHWLTVSHHFQPVGDPHTCVFHSQMNMWRLLELRTTTKARRVISPFCEIDGLSAQKVKEDVYQKRHNSEFKSLANEASASSWLLLVIALAYVTNV